MATIIDKIAWIHLDHSTILSTRSRGKDIDYIPGGKREPGETDLGTLVREIDEELAVTIIAAIARHLGTLSSALYTRPASCIDRDRPRLWPA
jgi:8-oxo-dGTP diphosphatase